MLNTKMPKLKRLYKFVMMAEVSTKKKQSNKKQSKTIAKMAKVSKKIKQ